MVYFVVYHQKIKSYIAFTVVVEKYRGWFL